MKEKYRQFYRSFHKGFQDRDPNVNSVLVNDGGVVSNGRTLLKVICVSL